MFGPHDWLSFQMLQTLHYTTYFSLYLPTLYTTCLPLLPQSTLLELLYMTCLPLLPQTTLLDHPHMTIVIAILFDHHTTPSILSKPQPQSILFIIGALVWFSTLVHLTDMFGLDWIFDYYLTSCLPLLGIQWWFKSIYAAAIALYSSLERPPPWPDPLPLTFDHAGNEKPYGYALQ